MIKNCCLTVAISANNRNKLRLFAEIISYCIVSRDYLCYNKLQYILIMVKDEVSPAVLQRNCKYPESNIGAICDFIPVSQSEVNAL